LQLLSRNSSALEVTWIAFIFLKSSKHSAMLVRWHAL
jgi:hypothetical protein